MRRRPFAALLPAAAGQHLADQLATAALPLAAVLLLGAGPAMVGVLLAAQGAAWLVCSLPAGLLVDACPRRRLLRLAGLVAALGLGAGALPGALLGQAWLLALGCFVASAGTVGFVLTCGALVPELTGRAGLAAGNARLELARALATLAAPPVVGLLAARGLLAAGFALGLLAALAALTAATALGRDPPPRAVPAADAAPLAARLREGAAFVLRQPLLRGIGLCALCWNFGFFALLAAFVPFALGPAGLSPALLGVAQSGHGAGLLAGAALAPAALRLLPPKAILLAGPVLSLAAPGLLLLAPAAGGGAALPFAAQALLGFGPMLWLVCQTGIRQLVTPPALLGRVGAVLQVGIYGVRPLGALAGGAVAGAFGPGAGVALAGLAFAAASLAVLASELRRLDRLPAAAPAWVCAITPARET